jgi:hypothetical protein
MIQEDETSPKSVAVRIITLILKYLLALIFTFVGLFSCFSVIFAAIGGAFSNEEAWGVNLLCLQMGMAPILFLGSVVIAFALVFALEKRAEHAVLMLKKKKRKPKEDGMWIEDPDN